VSLQGEGQKGPIRCWRSGTFKGLDTLGLASGDMEEVVGAFQRQPFQADNKNGLSEAWKERAIKELGEVDEEVEKQLNELADSLPNDWPLPRDDQFLLKFLRATSFNQAAALSMLSKYLRARRERPQYFATSHPRLARDTLATGIVTVLPHRDAMGRRVLVFRVNRWEPAKTSREEVFSAMILFLELLAREDETQVSGIAALVDMSGLCWSHWKQLSLDYIGCMVATVQGAFPIRFREIHVVNEYGVFHAVYALVRPFLTEKIRNRLQFHGCCYQNLQRSLGKPVLPSEYGGDQVVDEDENQEEVREALASLADYCSLLQELTV